LKQQTSRSAGVSELAKLEPPSDESQRIVIMKKIKPAKDKLLEQSSTTDG
jgi:hypothetical protein